MTQAETAANARLPRPSVAMARAAARTPRRFRSTYFGCSAPFEAARVHMDGAFFEACRIPELQDWTRALARAFHTLVLVRASVTLSDEKVPFWTSGGVFKPWKRTQAPGFDRIERRILETVMEERRPVAAFLHLSRREDAILTWGVDTGIDAETITGTNILDARTGLVGAGLRRPEWLVGAESILLAFRFSNSGHDRAAAVRRLSEEPERADQAGTNP